MVGKNEELLLTDFGIAIPAHSSSSWEAQKVIGSWTYSAPELFDAKAVPASDQYSLAVVVYEWLTGMPPFSGNAIQLWSQHHNAPPPPLQEKLKIPSGIEQIVRKGLAKKPEERYSNITAFAKALEKAVLEHQAAVAFSSTLATIYPSAPPARTLIPPTVPAWLTSRDADVAVPEISPPLPSIAQPKPNTPMPSTPVRTIPAPSLRLAQAISVPTPRTTAQKMERSFVSRVLRMAGFPTVLIYIILLNNSGIITQDGVVSWCVFSGMTIVSYFFIFISALRATTPRNSVSTWIGVVSGCIGLILLSIAFLAARSAPSYYFHSYVNQTTLQNALLVGVIGAITVLIGARCP